MSIPGMMKDKNPGQGLQPWSTGDIFPLVIARVEQYVGAHWDVLNADGDMSGFASYDDAHAAALGWLAHKATKNAQRAWYESSF